VTAQLSSRRKGTKNNFFYREVEDRLDAATKKIKRVAPMDTD